jgi:hypothetical protein
MLSFPPAVRIWLCLAPADLRKGFDALAELVRQHLRDDPLSAHVFVFRNRRGGRVKLLYWDTDGYVIVLSVWKLEPSVSRRQPKAGPEKACALPNWRCCWTASIGKTQSGPNATTGRRRRRRKAVGECSRASACRKNRDARLVVW